MLPSERYLYALQMWRTVSVKHLPSISSPTQVDWCEPCVICKCVNVSCVQWISITSTAQHQMDWALAAGCHVVAKLCDILGFSISYNQLTSFVSYCWLIILALFSLKEKKEEKTYNGSEWSQFLEELKISKNIMFDESVKVYHSEWLLNYKYINKTI